eukprot:TRINITY_DN33251_c0_g1_i1.p1 TRINITY_DN33251_c0_g1~~TRINITY_DN33251_c0_g1_i1.p1  ORF type:complete len:466 (-),score=45.32 TRINITY_DN33251_c0_g1_i1:312-1709(-)
MNVASLAWLFAMAALNSLDALPSTYDDSEQSSSPASTADGPRERALARVAARAAAREAKRVANGDVVLALTGLSSSLPEENTASAQVRSLPLSISIRTKGGVCERMLDRETSLPAKVSRVFTTTVDDQRVARLALYLGERGMCSGNRLLGLFQLEPLPEKSYRSFVQIEVALEVSMDGLVTCHAADVEGRLLSETYAEASWSGDISNIVEMVRSDDDTADEIGVFNHSFASHLPVLLATRTVDLPSGRTVVIRQHPRKEGERVGTGGVLWKAAIALSHYVVSARDRFNWSGKRVLELGAGTGLLAIALASERANVLATDGNVAVLEGARYNIENAGRLPGQALCEAFDWNSQEDLKRIRAMGPWDAILGSDLVYPGNAGAQCVATNDGVPPADKTLLDLLKALSAPETDIVIALKDRSGEVERFITRLNSDPDWSWAQVSPDALMSEFRESARLTIIHLRRSLST